MKENMFAIRGYVANEVRWEETSSVSGSPHSHVTSEQAKDAALLLLEYTKQLVIESSVDIVEWDVCGISFFFRVEVADEDGEVKLVPILAEEELERLK